MTKSILDEPFRPNNGGILRTFCLVALVLYALLITTSLFHGSHSLHMPLKKGAHAPTKKNVIMMVTDGMGPASLSLARSFRQYTQDLEINDILSMDHHLIGSSRTRSSSSLVTDSAAGATAFSCGLKSYNGAIGVDPKHMPCGTVLEALKLQGYLTGLVVTTRITDATPAAFSSHVDYRWQEDLIAQQQLGDSPLGRVVDLIIGGGRTHFLPPNLGGSRSDSRDIISEFSDWTYVGNRQQFEELDNGNNVSLPLLGLLADYDIPYEIDRDPKVYPSLAEQVKVALTALTKATEDSEQGFFLLIEGSRIDHAGHHNDPAAQVREVLAYDEAFQQVIDFIDTTDVETVAISTSDHETGGLVTARQISPDYPEYLWYPKVLAECKHSGEYLSEKILTFKASLKTEETGDLTESSEKKFDEFLSQVFAKDMGISPRPEEYQLVKSTNRPDTLLYALNNMISVRSETGWTTHGHSAVDVNIYGYSNSESINRKLLSHKENFGLLGNHENIEIGKFMADLTGVDLDEITTKIKHIKHSPHDDPEIHSSSQDHYQHVLNDDEDQLR